MYSIVIFLSDWTVSDWLMLIYDVVTAIAAFVAILALRQIRAQAKAMGDQIAEMKATNEIARVNMNALLNTERPWIVMRPRYASPNVLIDLVNEGRTPAKLVAWTRTRTFWPSADIGNLSLPLQKEELEHPQILVPHEARPFYSFDVTRDREFFDRAMAGSHRMIFFGMVRYSDTLGNDDLPPKETHYCYWFDISTSGFRMCGPKGANKNT